MSDAPASPPAARGTIRPREVFGYCMYDFANSAYTTLIVTVAYSTYFRQAVVGHTNPRGDFYWSLTQTLAYALVILISPVLGALADYSGRRKRFLLATTLVTVTACASLFFVVPGGIVLGIVLYVIGTVGFDAGYVFYNAFLPDVSTPRTIGRVSGLSWGTGFIGGLAALIACSPFLAAPLIDASGGLNPAGVLGHRTSFVVVAAFFALFSIPTFLFLRESGTPRALGHWSDYAKIGFRRVGETLTHLRRYREVGKFVAGSLFYYGGIEAVIKFSAIYATVTFGFEPGELVTLFIVTNIIAVPGTLLAGVVADWIGSRRALALTLVGWILLMFWGASTTSRAGFWLMAGGVAIGMGSTQAIARSFMAQISPPARESEFFGFYILAGKIGSILALLLFGAVSSGTGNQRTAVLWMLPLFVIGLTLVVWSRATPATTDPG